MDLIASDHTQHCIATENVNIRLSKSSPLALPVAPMSSSTLNSETLENDLSMSSMASLTRNKSVAWENDLSMSSLPSSTQNKTKPSESDLISSVPSLARKKSTVRTLENALSIDCKDELLLLVHQSKCGRTYRLDDNNNKIFAKQYTMKELEDVRRRPFASRLFISSVNIDWQTVWHRTRFTDNATYAVPTRKIRDYVKATITSHNEAAAKCSSE